VLEHRIVFYLSTFHKSLSYRCDVQGKVFRIIYTFYTPDELDEGRDVGA